MRSRNDYSIGTSISSRVTAAHSFAIRTAKMAVVQTPDCTLTLEALRAFAVIIIMSGYCYQYMATVGMHLPMNNQVSILLYNIQNMVTLFFVLAGVVTFLPIARAILKRQGIYPIWSVIVHRTVRVIPAYWFAIIVVWILHYSGQPNQWLELVQHLAFVQTFSTQNIFQTIGPAWLFSVEIWFYIFLACFTPLIYFFSTLLRSQTYRAMTLYILTIIFMAIGVGYKIWLYRTPYLPTDSHSLVLYYSLLSRFDNFAVGILLAVLLAMYERHKRHLFLACIATIAAISLTIGTYYYSGHYLSGSPSSLFYFCQFMWEIIAFLLLAGIVAAMNTSRQAVKKHGRSSFWEYLGSISYAMVMWYEPTFTWLNRYFIASSILFFALSLLSFILIILAVASLNYWIIGYPVSFLTHLFTHEGELYPRYIEQL